MRRHLVLAGIALVTVLALMDAVASWGAHRAENQVGARAEALSSASSRLPLLLGYRYESFARDRVVALAQTTGPFHDRFASVLDRSVAPAAAAKRISTSATVTGAGVVSDHAGGIVVLVFITQTTLAPGAATQVTASRVDVTMTRTGKGWLISDLRPV